MDNNKFWWLSFCDPDLPEEEQLLGAAIVRAKDGLSAVERARELGCNPGGEVMFVDLPLDMAMSFPKDCIETLLTTEEQFERIGGIARWPDHVDGECVCKNCHSPDEKS